MNSTTDALAEILAGLARIEARLDTLACGAALRTTNTWENVGYVAALLDCIERATGGESFRASDLFPVHDETMRMAMARVLAKQNTTTVGMLLARHNGQQVGEFAVTRYGKNRSTLWQVRRIPLQGG